MLLLSNNAIELGRAARQTSAPSARALTGRISVREINEELHWLAKPRQYNYFGSCVMARPVKVPDHPKVFEYPLPSYSGKVSQWFLMTSPSPQRGPNKKVICRAPTVYSTNNIVGATVTTKGIAYATSSMSAPTPFVNSEHVWELSNIRNFIGSFIDSNPNPVSFCNAFKNWMVGTHLNNVFSYLPSKAYPDFAALDSGVNNYKG